MTKVPQLPTELLERILLFLPVDPRNKESVRTLCSFGQANSRFLVTSRRPQIWEEHYKVRWRYFDPSREAERKWKYGEDDFTTLYRIRSSLDSEALTRLDAIINDPESRELEASYIVENFGLDFWDGLSIMTAGSALATTGTQGLTRRYWARELSSLIARERAIQIWADSGEDSFEKTLGGLSAFFGYDIEQISRELDHLSRCCQEHLYARNVSQESSLATAAEEICRWMRAHGFTRPTSLAHDNLMHNFPHYVLFENHRALPISLVHVFTSIARRLGYEAHPVAFPYKVLAVVLPRTDGEESIYVDVYDSTNKAILSHAELPSILQAMGLDIQNIPSITQYTEPATSSLMLLRAVKNIVSSLERFTHPNESAHVTAHCAAYCAAVLLTGDRRLVQHLFAGSEGPLDKLITLNRHLRPHLTLGAQEELDLCLQKDTRDSKDLPRTKGRSCILYYVGMPFRHLKYHYIGVIKGWDYSCEASEEWIRRMRVDDLPRGREQPFYNTYTLADGRIRYVAEENISPIKTIDFTDVNGILGSHRSFGRWFDGVELYPSGRTRFIQSKESKLIFPDDEAVALSFIDITTPPE